MEHITDKLLQRALLAAGPNPLAVKLRHIIDDHEGPWWRLSPRERDVFDRARFFYAEPLNALAAQLGIKPRTVRKMADSINRKLGVSGRHEWIELSERYYKRASEDYRNKKRRGTRRKGSQ